MANLSKVKFGGIKYLNCALQNRHAFLRTLQFICALTVLFKICKFEIFFVDFSFLFIGNFNCRNNSLGDKGNQLISSKIQRNNNESLAHCQFLKLNDYKSFKDFFEKYFKEKTDVFWSEDSRFLSSFSIISDFIFAKISWS